MTIIVSRGAEPTTVPTVAGVPEADARRLLDEAGFVVAEEAIAQVDAGIAPGSAIAIVSIDDDGAETALAEGADSFRGTAVSLIVSLGPLPDVVGVEPATASAAFQSLGLTATVGGDTEFDNEIAEGLVLRAVPAEEGPIRPGDSFTLVVSRGPDLVEIPDVIGETINDAAEILRQAGFGVIVETDIDDERFWGTPFARVQESRPGPGERAIRGSDVTIVSYFAG